MMKLQELRTLLDKILNDPERTEEVISEWGITAENVDDAIYFVKTTNGV